VVARGQRARHERRIGGRAQRSRARLAQAAARLRRMDAAAVRSCRVWVRPGPTS